MKETQHTKQVVAAIVVRGRRVLICQRRHDQPFALEWEFPGGKIEPGEQPAQALARELDEELGIQATIGREIACVRHRYAEGLAVELRFYLVTAFTGEPANRIFQQIRWEEHPALDVASFLEADRGVVQKLKNGALVWNHPAGRAAF